MGLCTIRLLAVTTSETPLNFHDTSLKTCSCCPFSNRVPPVQVSRIISDDWCQQLMGGKPTWLLNQHSRREFPNRKKNSQFSTRTPRSGVSVRSVTNLSFRMPPTPPFFFHSSLRNFKEQLM